MLPILVLPHCGSNNKRTAERKGFLTEDRSKTPMTEPEPPRKPSSKVRWVVAGCIFAGVAVIALVVRMAIFVSYKQPSASMWPTFVTGDRVNVSRFDTTPVRGGVFVFKFPEHPEQLFFKRVVGMPGDAVEVKRGVVLVNGWSVPRCSVGKVSYEDPSRHEGELVVEHLGDADYLVFHEDGSLFPDYQGPYRVKPGEYFMLGDNRYNSHDSRMWFGGVGGGVPRDHFVGRVRTSAPALPRGYESLRPALDACLAKRPANTSPPSK